MVFSGNGDSDCEDLFGADTLIMKKLKNGTPVGKIAKDNTELAFTTPTSSSLASSAMAKVNNFCVNISDMLRLILLRSSFPAAPLKI